MLLAQAFAENHISMVKLNLQTGNALVLKSAYDPELLGTKCSWEALVERYALRRAAPVDRELVLSLTLERMRALRHEGMGARPLEIRCLSPDDPLRLQWVELAVSKAGSDESVALITTRNIEETRLMRRIVDLFVYRNYDYLFLIDAKRDAYTRFTGSKGKIPVPPESGSHYTEDMVRYNREYVTPEDCERVTANMQLAHVVKMLEQMDIYSFTSGGITKDGKYRRSRVLFLYYDKTAGMILTARTDVTQIYLEEQEKSMQLADALRRAQHDAMTGLYNQKATEELVQRSLDSQYRSMAAVMFIDVDNFKMVNDTLGHQKGDELLCFLARHIREIAGRNGIAGRIGGDEYLLYLPVISTCEELEKIARKICGIFQTFSTGPLLQESISCSVGISIYPRDGTDYATLLRKADQALYTSKRYGKNRYYLYSREAEELPALDGGMHL